MYTLSMSRLLETLTQSFAQPIIENATGITAEERTGLYPGDYNFSQVEQTVLSFKNKFPNLKISPEQEEVILEMAKVQCARGEAVQRLRARIFNAGLYEINEVTEQAIQDEEVALSNKPKTRANSEYYQWLQKGGIRKIAEQAKDMRVFMTDIIFTGRYDDKTYWSNEDVMKWFTDVYSRNLSHRHIKPADSLAQSSTDEYSPEFFFQTHLNTEAHSIDDRELIHFINEVKSIQMLRELYPSLRISPDGYLRNSEDLFSLFDNQADIPQADRLRSLVIGYYRDLIYSKPIMYNPSLRDLPENIQIKTISISQDSSVLKIIGSDLQKAKQLVLESPFKFGRDENTLFRLIILFPWTRSELQELYNHFKSVDTDITMPAELS